MVAEPHGSYMFPPKGDQGCVKTTSLVGFTVPSDGENSLVSSDPREVVKWSVIGVSQNRP